MKNLQEACHLFNNLSVLSPTRLHTRHFTLSSQTSFGYFPTLHMKKQIQREEYHRANTAQYKDLNWVLSGWKPQPLLISTLKLFKNSLALPGPSTSWPPPFWCVNQTRFCLPLNSAAFCLHLSSAFLSYICLTSQIDCKTAKSELRFKITVSLPHDTWHRTLNKTAFPRSQNAQILNAEMLTQSFSPSTSLIQVGTWTEFHSRS